VRQPGCHQATRIVDRLFGPVHVTGLLTASTGAYALRAQTQVIGTLQGDSNFSDPTRSVSEFNVFTETPVPDSLPPIFGTVQGTAKADGEAGTLRVRVGVTSPGPGPGLGIVPGVMLEMQAFMSETYQILQTSGTRRPGLVGLGTAGDGHITIRATGTLLGSASIGSATGVPPDLAVANAGSTRAVFSLVLSAGSNSLRTLVKIIFNIRLFLSGCGGVALLDNSPRYCLRIAPCRNHSGTPSS